MQKRRELAFSYLLILSLQPLILLSAATSLLPDAALLSPDALALLSFEASADISNILPFSSKKHSNHCQWLGVTCAGVKVVRFVLEGLPLKGSFAENTLTRLDQLRVLSLQNNSLSGPIPNLSGLINLKTLFLDHNAFSGSFPSSILTLHRIRILDLSNNNLSGPILPGIVTLGRLYYLRLESNRFNGTIPPLNQSSLRIFNFSSNELSGAIPETPILSSFDDTSAFSGNPGLCGEMIHKQCQSHSPFFSSSIAPNPPSMAEEQSGQLQGLLLPAPSSKNHKKTAAAIIGICVGILLVIGFLVITSVGIKRLLQKRRIAAPMMASSVMDDAESAASVAVVSDRKKIEGLEMGKSGNLIFCAGEAQVYTVDQLMRGSAEMLGRGTVGTTYKAILENQLIVSVKRLDARKMGGMSKEGFERHMEGVGNLRHPNLVPLRAFFQAMEERLLVYDYQPNGSLFTLIHGSRSARAKPLHWTSCLKIAEDVAQGLEYIHRASGLVHGNLKSSNVLLGPDFEACLTDYCLMAMVEATPEDTDYGYRAPETRKSIQRATAKSDVYGFGMLLLELTTGRAPLEQPVLMSTDLVSWVRSVRVEEDSEYNHLTLLLDIAIACIRRLPDQRPTTWQVLKMIREVKETELGD
ncbi:probable inactive receptor kinase At5g67200 [Magnolia sinica]|uniref:probable inactive receptor kinase At5g67200 n=1 Tax=Magnolia sinica TaxID=86752 RepID=UPI0026598E14|nr:probable inactive receptor kinase At5g67200 [Magnolia sinica]